MDGLTGRADVVAVSTDVPGLSLESLHERLSKIETALSIISQRSENALDALGDVRALLSEQHALASELRRLCAQVKPKLEPQPEEVAGYLHMHDKQCPGCAYAAGYVHGETRDLDDPSGDL